MRKNRSYQWLEAACEPEVNGNTEAGEALSVHFPPQMYAQAGLCFGDKQEIEIKQAFRPG